MVAVLVVLFPKRLCTMVVTFSLPSYPDRPMEWHCIQDQRVFLKSLEDSLQDLNNVLHDPDLPVNVQPPPRGCRLGVEKQWEEFQGMSSEKKRAVIEHLCKGSIEALQKVIDETKRKILERELRLNALELKPKRKGLRYRLFGSKTLAKLAKGEGDSSHT